MEKTILQECVENLAKTLTRRIEERIEEGCEIKEKESFATIDGVTVFNTYRKDLCDGYIVLQIDSEYIAEIFGDVDAIQAKRKELLAELEEIDKQLNETWK